MGFVPAGCSPVAGTDEIGHAGNPDIELRRAAQISCKAVTLPPNIS